MRFNTFKKCAIAATFATASVGLNAADATYNVGFTTVPDISIVQIQAMDFGGFLGLTNGAACTMEIEDFNNAATKYPGDTLLNLASTGPSPAAANSGDLTTCGSAGGTDKGTIGVYEIQGIPGGDVKVTVNNITTGADFNYTAVGCVGDYNGAGDGDTCNAVTAGTQQTVTLAAPGDTVGNGVGEGIPAPGATRIALAGTITATAVHLAGQTLTESFVIDVTY